MSFERSPSMQAVEVESPSRTIADEAAHWARLDRAVAEPMIDTRATAAIRAWRLDEATYWQRVKFHSRRLRAQRSLRS